MDAITEQRYKREHMQTLIAKTKKEREASAWISPDGTWYNVPSCEHFNFSIMVLEVKYGKEWGGDDCRHDLVDLGWILIRTWTRKGETKISVDIERMTLKQFNVLKEKFGDNQQFSHTGGWYDSLNILQLFANYRGD